ncbi:hypothetical protein EMIT0111MI5_20140 [Burkholderia sp. IT-111MI5]
MQRRDPVAGHSLEPVGERRQRRAHRPRRVTRVARFGRAAWFGRRIVGPSPVRRRLARLKVMPAVTMAMPASAGACPRSR